MLYEAAKRAVVRETSARFQSYFDDGVKRVFAPYNPGCVHLVIHAQPSRGRYVDVTFSNFPNHPLTMWVDILEDPYILLDYMIEQIAYHFKTIRVEPDNDHIVLGED